MSLVSVDLATLTRFSAFVLNRATGDFRSELHEYLVMMTLEEEDAQSKGMTTQQIISFIEKDLKVEKFPNPLIRSALETLEKKQFIESIHSKDGKIYFLTQDKKTKIKLMKKEYTQTSSRVKENLSKRIDKIIGTPLDSVQQTMAFITFQNFLGTVLAKLGAEWAFAIIGSHGKEFGVLKPINISEELNNTLESIEDKTLREAEKQAFIEYLSEPDENVRDYLFSLAQTYFIIQILRLDPQCQSLTRQSLQQKKVYLDTNIIVFSLTGNKAVDMALKLTNDLKIGIVFSNRTKEEFTSLVARSRRRFGKNPKVPNNRFAKVQKKFKGGFLKEFLKKRKRNPNLTYERYADRLEEIETIMKNKYSATFDNNTYDEIVKHPDLPQLKKTVVDKGVAFGLFKTDFVAKHDAFHILLIQELRKKKVGDVLGPNYWFLTHDRSLLFVEKKFGKHERIPSSIYIDNWVQLISLLVVPEQTKNARDAYTALFASRLPVLSRLIDEEVFLAAQGKWMDDEDLTPEDVARVMGNRYIKDYLEKASSKDKEISEEEREIAIQPVIGELKSQKKETAKLKQEITELRQATTELQNKSTTLEQRVTKYENAITGYQTIIHKLGYLVSAIFFFGVWYLLYQFILLPKMESWQASVLAITISTITGYLAGFRGYKWLVDRILEYSLKK